MAEKNIETFTNPDKFTQNERMETAALHIISRIFRRGADFYGG